MKEYANIEFHRQGYGMLADPGEKNPGAPVCFPRTEGGRVMTGFCDCREGKKGASCRHFSELSRLAAELKKQHRGLTAWDKYTESRWYRLGALLSDRDPVSHKRAEIRQATLASGPAHIFTLPNNLLLARLPDTTGSSVRFLERIGATPRQGVLNRADRIEKSPCTCG